jgi:hypothetical protein
MNKQAALGPRRLGGTAILGVLLVGGLGFGPPVSAHEKERDTREVRNVIIKRAGKDGKPIILEGRELSELREKCSGTERAESNVSSGDQKNKFVTRIVICGDKGETSAQTRAKLIEALERARADLGERDEMGAAHRAEAMAALEREIARIRSQSE